MKDAPDAILRPEQAAYLEALEPVRDALLMRMETLAASRGEPISDPEVASFLSVVASSLSARAPFVVELGTNIGYGAIVLGRAVGPSGRVVSIELDAKLCADARRFVEEAKLGGRVEVREGRALEVIAKLERPIDLAYVDCMKEEYPAYFDALVPRLAPHGVLVADNVLWKGHVAAAEVPEGERARTLALREFNRRVVSDPRLTGVILPLGDGIAFAVRRA
jgi:caffeoyl-CoA O-methyltransferase